MVPPLVQPKSPEFPLGVLTVTLAVPGAEISAEVMVTCNWVLLVTKVLSVVPFITPTVAETKWLPFTVRTKPSCTWASVIVLTESDPMVGAGRALPHAGLSELHDWNMSKASRVAPRVRKKVPTCFIGDRTTLGTKCRSDRQNVQKWPWYEIDGSASSSFEAAHVFA